MDPTTRAFLNRLTEGRGPVETAVLLKEVVGRALRFAGVSRAGRKQFFEQLAREFPPPGGGPAPGPSPAAPRRGRPDRKEVGMKERPECPACGAAVGELHQGGCDVEPCPYCGGQLFSCCSEDSFEGVPDEDRMPWTGLWPGAAECIAFGWYCRPCPAAGRRAGLTSPTPART